MHKASFEDNQDIHLKENCELLIKNLKGILTLESSVKKLFVSELVDSELNINIEHDISIIFLHNKGSSISKVNIDVKNPKAHVNVREVVVTEGNNVYNKEVNLIHTSPVTFSDYKFFGFAIDNSSLRISAKSKVLQGMSGSEAHQILRVFTDGNARAEGQPGLFIDDFDVKASHGNSIGQINQRDLYYLQTKGISRTLARWIIIKGQMTEALSQLEDDTKERIINDIKDTLKVKELHG